MCEASVEEAKLGIDQFHVRNCSADPNFSPPLSLKVNDVAICCSRIGSTTFERCTVLELRPSNAPRGTAYRVQKAISQTEMFIPSDTHDHIRPVSYDINDNVQNMLNLVKYEFDYKSIALMINEDHLDWKYFGPLLMHFSATCGI